MLLIATCGAYGYAMSSKYNRRPPAREFIICHMKPVGIIGWRGMVGSVLLDRMRDEKDFDLVTPTFFSTSQAGAARSARSARGPAAVQDANDIAALAKLPMLISTQGGDYTQSIHPRLRAAGWQGYWIDAASSLRMEKNAVIVLDPVNLPVMQAAAARGVQGFHRRQLHRIADADGGRRTAAGGGGGMDHRDDLPVGLGGGRAKHARTAASRWAHCTARRRLCWRIPLPAFWRSIER